ncbi:MAG: shikimate kinase [Terriglobales bacterium]
MSTRPAGPSGTSKAVPASGVRAVVLVGFMGAGKSSVGAALGRRLGWPFEDLDVRIEAQEKRTVEQIFRQSGEGAFRHLEHAALRSLVDELIASAKVVALGGGAFAQANNAALLERDGLSTVFLDAPVEELFRRCQEQRVDRPLRGDLEEFRRLYETRRPCYLKAALRIDTAGKDVETVAREAIDRLGLQ